MKLNVNLMFGGLILSLGSTLGVASGVEVVADREAARGRLEKALANEDLDLAAEVAEDLAFAELVDYLDVSYELLLIHCRRGDEGQAFETVEMMLDAGFWNYRRLMSDKGLELINSTDRLRAMIRSTWAKRYISMLERDSRDAMQHPDRIMKALSIKPGSTVADIGAGSGYFTVRLAEAVGADGAVIATDIRQEMLDFIGERLEGGAIDNVELFKVEPGDPGLPGGRIDTVLMVDVMHYVKDRVAYAEKLRQALAPGGRVAIVDFRYEPDSDREFAPPPEQQIARDVLDHEMSEAGFEVAEAFDFLPEQYFVIYRLAE